MKGFGKVFAFTLKQLTSVKLYRMLTLIMALILFFGPVTLFPMMERNSMRNGQNYTEAADEEDGVGTDEEDGDAADEEDDDAADEEDGDAADEEDSDGENAEALEAKLSTIYLVDAYEGFDWYSVLANRLPGFEDCTMVAMDSIEAANEACKEGDAATILYLTAYAEEETGSDSEGESGNGRSAGVLATGLVPDNSACGSTVAWIMTEAFYNHYGELLLPEWTEAQFEELEKVREEADAAAVAQAAQEAQEAEILTEEEESMLFLQDMFGYILPYLNIMVIYFLTLYYGQTVSNNVIQEKNSKLMDTMLISVKPREMIFGKVAATWVASLIQFLTWIIALFAGIGIGSRLVLAMNPDTSNIVIFVLEVFKNIMGSFAIPSIILAVLLVLGGFFLYCALAAVGGSLASKPEELSSTNIIFTVVLIGSFFMTLSSGFMDGSAKAGISFFDCFPFTAVLITPSRILLGQVSFAGGLLSLGLILLLSVVIMMVAGKLYTMLAMYRGKAPSPKKIIQMLAGK